MHHRYPLRPICLLWLLPLLLSGRSLAQTLATRLYTLADGLPQSTVYALAQDAQGQLWAGTQGGVARFDGRQFHAYDTHHGLPDNHVTAVLPRSGGRVLLGHYYGAVTEIDPAGQIHRLGPRGWLAGAPVRQLLPASGPGLWVATTGAGLYRLGAAGAAPWHLSRATGLRCDTLYQLASGPGRQLWVATAGGLSVLDAATGRVLPTPELPAALTRQRVYSLCRVADTLYWLGLDAGLGRLHRANAAAPWQLQVLAAGQGLCGSAVERAVADRRGRVWALSATGVSRYEPATGTSTCFALPNLVTDQTSSGLLLDHEDNLWVALSEGLLQHAADEQFALFGTTEGLTDPDVQAVLGLGHGLYWIGTPSGLWEFRPDAPAGQRFRRGHLRPGGAAANFVRPLYRDARGRVWVGSRGGGAAVYYPDENRWLELSGVPGVAGQNVRAFVEDRLGRMWVLTAGAGATVLPDPSTSAPRHYDRTTGLGTNALWTGFRDRRGTLWLGTDDHGLVRVDVQPDAPDQLRRAAGRVDRLSIGSITEDGRGNLWLGSIGEGLLRFDGQRLRAFGPTTGLRSNNPYFVRCDAAGDLWLGTNHGLDHFDPRTGRTRSYGPTEGFLGQETNQNAVVLERGGRMWVGTVNGLMRYDPARAQPNRTAPHTRLTALRVQGQDTTLGSGFRLPYALNKLAFDFVGVSLTNPGRVRYQYRLVGFDADWSRPGATTTATYTNLPPGDYTFEVRAANNDGVWSVAPTRLAFHIRPPWWRTWWAYALYAAVLTGAFYLVRRQTQRRERDRARQQLEYQALTHLQEMDRVKNDFFTHLSHELRTPLTLILGPAEELARDEAAPAPVRQQGTRILSNARKLLHLINQILDLSKLDAGGLSLHPEAGDVAAAARQWVAAFQALADARQVGLHLAAPAGEVPLVFDVARLEEVVSNLLANALRFTPAGGHVLLTVRDEAPTAQAPAGSVLLSVQDTGVGIAPEHLPQLFDRFYQVPGSGSEAAGSGVGLALVKELTERHGGSVQVLSTPGVGTTFIVRLPRVLEAAAASSSAARPIPSPDLVLSAPAPPVAEAEPTAFSPLAQAVILPESDPVTAAAEPGADADVVLVVEDNPDVREYLDAMLRAEGYRVLTAPDGPTGATVAREAVPSLVVSDVMMPGFDGYELCRQLRTDVATSHIPVVLLTARSAAADRLAGLETGADAYVAKPFDPRELRAQVRNLLALRRRAQVPLLPAPDAAPAPVPRRALAVMPEAFEAYAAAVAALPSLDKAFLERVERAVERHLDNGEFSVEMLSEEVALSRAQLHRKLKALTGEAPSDFIRGLRLRRAHVLLAARAGTVSEVAYQVGFNSPAHFSTSFSRQFGYAPSEVPTLVLPE